MEGKLSKRKDLKRLYRAGTLSLDQYSQELATLELKEKPKTDNSKKKAWVYHMIIKNKWELEGRPSINDIKTIAFKMKKERYRILFIVLYLTAARISEIVRVFSKRHIEEAIINNRPFLIMRLVNRKNRKRKYKEISVPLDYPKQEAELAKIVLEYIS